MLKSLPLVFLLALPSLAALNGRCTGSKAKGQYKEDGICITTSTCKKYKGTTTNGACPYDSDDVKCCIIDECNGRPEGLFDHSRCTWTADKDNVCSRWLNSEYLIRSGSC
jgi:hypothetical protein